MIPEMSNRGNWCPIPNYSDWDKRIREKEAKGKEPLIKFFERLPCQSLDFANRVDTLTGRRFSTLLSNKIDQGSSYCLAVMKNTDKHTGQVTFKFHDALALNGYMSACFKDPEGKFDEFELFYFTTTSKEDPQLKFWKSWADWKPEDVDRLAATATLDELEPISIFEGLAFSIKEHEEIKDYNAAYNLCLKALALDVTEEKKAPVRHTLAEILLSEKDVRGVTAEQRHERHQQAIRSLELAGNTEYNPSLFLLAQCSLYGVGGLELANYAKYMCRVDPRFSRDIPIYNAIYNVSYNKATCFNCEKVKALHNIEPLFNYIHPHANIIMGHCYQAGYGLSTNPVMASQLYFDALNQQQPSRLFACLAYINLKKLSQIYPVQAQNSLPETVDNQLNALISNCTTQLNPFGKLQLAYHLREGIFTDRDVSYADFITPKIAQN